MLKIIFKNLYIFTDPEIVEANVFSTLFSPFAFTENAQNLLPLIIPGNKKYHYQWITACVC